MLLWAVVKNAFPISETHNIVVVCDESGGKRKFPHIPQQLSRELTSEMAKLALQSPHCYFFNGMTAGGTVSHFHLQTISASIPPIATDAHTLPGLRSLATLRDWPCAAFVFGLED